MDEGLQPILLFKVQFTQKNGRKKTRTMRGVYYIPQRGVGLDGFISDGSVRNIARHLANTPGFGTIEGAAVRPEALTVEAIESAIRDWMLEKED